MLSALLLILAVNLVPDGQWAVFFCFWSVLTVLVGLSGVGFPQFFRRCLLAVPFALAAVAIPFTSPGAVVAELPWLGWRVTEPGLIRFGSVLCRFWLAVGAAVLMSGITPFADLIWALRKLRMPSALVSIVGLMYRYLFVVGDEAIRMMRARSSRSCTRQGAHRPSVVWQAEVAGHMVGSLFLRALARSERIHVAMLSRGYDGTPKMLVKHEVRLRDWCAVTIFILLVVAVASMRSL